MKSMLHRTGLRAHLKAPHQKPFPPCTRTDSFKSFLGSFPMNNIPDRIEVFCFAVLVLETVQFVSSRSVWSVVDRRQDILVGVLPGIDSKQGDKLSNDRILIL